MQTGRSGLAHWLAGVVTLGAAIGVVLLAGAASASTTVTAQLSLSGVATASSPTGGSVVAIHPGDTVDFEPAAAPTQGLTALGVPLGDLVGGVLGGATGYQVVLHLPATFPGGKRDVKLGACGGQKDVSVSFPNAGTYSFSWSAYAVNLLCLGSGAGMTLDATTAMQHGIALNAQNQWVGKVVAASAPPTGGQSAPLPTVNAAPKTAPAHLPGSSSSNPAHGRPTSSSGGIDNTPEQSIAAQAVPKSPDIRRDHIPHATEFAPPTVLSGNTLPGGGGGVGTEADMPLPSHSASPIDIAAHKAPARLPDPLAIIAILALSVVIATYVRLWLIHMRAG